LVRDDLLDKFAKIKSPRKFGEKYLSSEKAQNGTLSAADSYYYMNRWLLVAHHIARSQEYVKQKSLREVLQMTSDTPESRIFAGESKLPMCNKILLSRQFVRDGIDVPEGTDPWTENHVDWVKLIEDWNLSLSTNTSFNQIDNII
jgi:hypothetical protein